jgi:hypothetical protein
MWNYGERGDASLCGHRGLQIEGWKRYSSVQKKKTGKGEEGRREECAPLLIHTTALLHHP